jgi:hypothetical protein
MHALRVRSPRIPTISMDVVGGFMKIGRFARPLVEYSLIAIFVLMGAGPFRALAQEKHTQMIMSQRARPDVGAEQSGGRLDQSRPGSDRALPERVGGSGGRIFLQFGCVSGHDSGAMGMHFWSN